MLDEEEERVKEFLSEQLATLRWQPRLSVLRDGLLREIPRGRAHLAQRISLGTGLQPPFLWVNLCHSLSFSIANVHHMK